MNHFHSQGLDFDYPASWTIHDQLPASTGFGQTFAVIGTHAWPSSCGASDINCYYEATLEPGTIAVDIGVVYFPATDDDLCVRGATGIDLQGRGPDDPVATRTLIRVDARPTLKTTYAVGGKDYYLSDEWLDWEIAAAGTVDEAYTIDAKVRGPGTDAMKAELDALIASIRLTPGPNAGQGPADCGAPFPAVGASPAPSDPDRARAGDRTAAESPAERGGPACDQALLPARIVRAGNAVKAVSPDTGAESTVSWPLRVPARTSSAGSPRSSPRREGGRPRRRPRRPGWRTGLGGVSPAFHVCAVNADHLSPAP